MRQLEVTAYEGPSALRFVERELPTPRPGQLLIKVHAAGINWADLAQTQGMYPGGPKPPYIAGMEAAGEVVAVGPDSPIPVGAKVMGMGPRAFADHVIWPVQSVFPKPDAWSWTQAAAFPVQWLTAHGCLRVVGRLVEGENVLIHAAAGGVGVAAVRLAKHFGATVIGTAGSDEKCAAVLENGADLAINYRTTDFAEAVMDWTQGDGIDLCLEMVGGETFKKNLGVIRPYGRMVVFGAASNEPARIHNVRLIFSPIEVSGYHLTVMMDKRPDLFGMQWSEMVRLIAEGVVVPDEPTVYALDDAAKALTDLAERKTRGKLVLVPLGAP